jgi:hypothetical protein
MNNLIKELAEQATQKYDRLGNEIPYAQPDLELFAELIVTRCASIVSLYRRDNMQDIAVADTLESAYHEIRNTFGLK